MDNKKRIQVYDTTLRDGEQAPGFSMSVDGKVTMAKQLIKLGVDVIEAGFPMASQADSLAVEQICNISENVTISALARARNEDIKCAWESLKNAKNPRIHIFIQSSSVQIKYQLEKTPLEVIEQARKSVMYAKQFCDDVQFSAMDATRSDKRFLAYLFSEVIDAGAKTVNISDTVGHVVPHEVKFLIEYLREHVAGIDSNVLSIHCHNDLGMATANTISAIRAGVDQVECTVNGIGERAGNAALEEVVMALDVRSDVYDQFTSINTKLLMESSRLLTEITGTGVQPNKAIVGANAFLHQSGIHQDGLVKSKNTYELFSPQKVGDIDTQFVLGRHSGKSGLLKQLELMGIASETINIQAVLQKIKNLTECNRQIIEDDLLTIINETSNMIN